MIDCRIRAFLAAVLLTPCWAWGQSPPSIGVQQNLKALSIEELMTIDVTTANRREAPVDSTAAAVSVVTRDDIRRSGVTTRR